MMLNEVFRQWRWATKRTVRDVAKEVGISPATVSRFERGEDCDSNTLSILLRWLLQGEAKGERI